MAALAIMLAFLWTQAARADDVTVNVQAGGLVSLASDADAALAPTARVLVSLPLAKAPAKPAGAFPVPPLLHLQADFTALPGESVAIEDPTTFRALEFRGGLAQRIHMDVNVDLYAEAGFATRLPGALQARDRAVRWAAAGLRIGRPAERGWLTLTAGADQRLDGLWRPVVILAGAVELYDGDRALGAHLFLVGEAILGLGYGPQAQHDVVRAGVAVGR